MAWPNNLLTDSGGFQMVSLLELAEITEEGVTFQSHEAAAANNNNNNNNGTNSLLLTPEQSIAHQNRIGADIIMQLDDVVSSVGTTPQRFNEAMNRSVRWLDRCIAAHARPAQQSLFPIIQTSVQVWINVASTQHLLVCNACTLLRTYCYTVCTLALLLHAVLQIQLSVSERLQLAASNSSTAYLAVSYCSETMTAVSTSACMHAHCNRTQGGLDVSPGGMREQCLAAMIARDMPGYAIGGMAGGEQKDAFWKVVAQACDALPIGKPRYLMGVGYPLDLVVCTALGCDMFDCVYPTRTARLGVALVPEPGGMLRLRGREALNELGPIEVGCPCMACSGWPDPSVTAAAVTATDDDDDGADTTSSDNAASASSAQAAAAADATAAGDAATATADLDAALVQLTVSSTDGVTSAINDVNSSDCSSDC
eukprot:13538-Heterococcus_DN1.PRE.1